MFIIANRGMLLGSVLFFIALTSCFSSFSWVGFRNIQPASSSKRPSGFLKRTCVLSKPVALSLRGGSGDEQGTDDEGGKNNIKVRMPR
jgi:hypothetical protein